MDNIKAYLRSDKAQTLGAVLINVLGILVMVGVFLCAAYAVKTAAEFEAYMALILDDNWRFNDVHYKFVVLLIVTFGGILYIAYSLINIGRVLWGGVGRATSRTPGICACTQDQEQ